MISLAGAGSFLSGLGAVGSLFGGGSAKGAQMRTYGLNRAQSWEDFYRNKSLADEYWARDYGVMSQHRLEDFNERQNAIRYRVNDAKLAGLHPLFALGASTGSGSPASIVPHQAPGSTTPGTPGMADGGRDVGGVLRRAGQALSGISEARKQNRRADRLANAQVKLYEAEAALADSKAKRAEQHTTQTFPAPPSTTLESRYKHFPVKREAELHMPENVVLYDSQGNTYEVWNPDAGFDELTSPATIGRVYAKGRMAIQRHKRNMLRRFRRAKESQ